MGAFDDLPSSTSVFSDLPSAGRGTPAMPPPKKSFMDKVTDFAAQNFGDTPAVGVEMPGTPGLAEGLASAATGVASWIPAGLSMFSHVGRPVADVSLRDKANTAKSIQELFTYNPPSEEGKAVAAALASPFTKLAETGESSGESWDKMAEEAALRGDKAAAEAYRALGLAARVGGEALPFILPMAKGPLKSAKESAIPRGLEDVMNPEPTAPVMKPPPVPPMPPPTSQFNPALARAFKEARERPSALPPGQAFELKGGAYDPNNQPIVFDELGQLAGRSEPLPTRTVSQHVPGIEELIAQAGREGNRGIVDEITTDQFTAAPEVMPAPSMIPTRTIAEEGILLNRGGRPYRNEASATEAMDKKGLGETYEVIPYEKGFALKRKGEPTMEQATAPAPEAAKAVIEQQMSPEKVEGNKTQETPAVPAGETTATVPPPTFREFVESKGKTWPMSAKDPEYPSLMAEYDGLQAVAKIGTPYPGYREIMPGEILGPGADVKMDMATGKNYLKEVIAPAEKPPVLPTGKAVKAKTEPSATAEPPQGAIVQPEVIAAGKQPIQMTNTEFREYKFSNLTDKQKSKWAEPGREASKSSVTAQWDQEHGDIIRQALAEGKPVPPEVLKDYPDLAPAEQAITSAKAEVSNIATPEARPIDKLFSQRGSFSLKFKDDIREKIKGKLPPETDAAKVDAMYERTEAKRAEREAVTLKKIRDVFVRGMVDVSGNLKREALKIDPELGKQVVMDRELLSGASGKAAAIIDEARNGIFDGLRADRAEVLNRVIQSRRIIDIDAYKEGMKHPEGLTGKEHAEYLAALEKADPALSQDINARADKYFQVMRDQVADLQKNGMLTQESARALMSHEYSPRQFFQYIDPENSYNLGGKKITVPDSGIKALDEGSLSLLENNAERLMSEVVIRTQARIFRNQANKSLYEFSKANPDNGIVRPAEIIGATETTYAVEMQGRDAAVRVFKTKTEADRFMKDSAGKYKTPLSVTERKGHPVYEDTPGGFEKIKVMIDGQAKEMIMPGEMAQEWVKSDPLIDNMLATVVSTLTGAKFLRPIATGYNPGFALTNLPRDIALVWNATTEYSMHLPKAIAQMGKDFATVAPDVFKRTGRVKDYVDDGGGMNFMTYQGRFSETGHIGESLKSIGNVMGWLGETSELWTRLALRERAIQNGASPKEATWAARRYLDFNQGGNIAKGLDTAIPYLNASIQGTRSLFRAAKENPAVFTYKFAQLATVATGLYMANYLVNPEAWQSITDREKEANFIITTPFYFYDDKGQKKYYYAKIAKDQGQRIVMSTFEALMTKAFEGKFPSEQVFMAIGDMVNMTGLPPTIGAALSYALNKDTWTKQDIWRGPKNVDEKEEFSKTTHPFWVTMGKMTGMSPERMGTSAGKMIPPNNPFVGLVGGGYKLITGNLGKDLEDKSMGQILTEIPSVRRVLATTNPYTPYRDDIDEVNRKENTRRLIMHRDFDALTEEFLKKRVPETAKKIADFVAPLPDEDKDRLTNRLEKQISLDKVPDRTWWVNAAEMPPESRALIFWDRFKKESPEERKKMIEIATDRLSSFASERFTDKLANLIEGERKPTKDGTGLFEKKAVGF